MVPVSDARDTVRSIAKIFDDVSLEEQTLPSIAFDASLVGGRSVAALLKQSKPLRAGTATAMPMLETVGEELESDENEEEGVAGAVAIGEGVREEPNKGIIGGEVSDAEELVRKTGIDAGEYATNNEYVTLDTKHLYSVLFYF